MLDLANVWRRPQSFTGTDHYGLRLINLTSTQRDALTGSGAAKAGALIWNTTTSAVEFYTGSVWLILPNNLDATEFGYINGVVAGTAAASKALVVDANKDIATLRDVTMRSLTNTDGNINVTGSGLNGHITAAGNITGAHFLTAENVGTVTTGATTAAAEHGDGVDHLTVLTMTAFAVGTGGDNADLAIGAKFYTFPAGSILVENATLRGIFDQASHGTITDGEAGIGTVVGSTAVDTLGEVGATSENVITGDNAALSTYVLGTTVVEAVGIPSLLIATAGVHDLYLNIAATWPDIAAAEAVTFTGVITLRWRKIS